MSHREPNYAMFPTEEYLERVERARERMDAHGIDALIITAKENGIYFSGIRTIGWNSKHRPLGIIVPRDNSKPVISVIAESLFDVAYQSSWIEEVRPWGGWRIADAAPDPLTAIYDACEQLGVADGTIGLELGYGQRIAMSQSDFEDLTGRFTKARFVDVGPLMWELRMFKSAREVEKLRVAADATTRAYEKAFAELRPGMTERELGSLLLSEMVLQTGEMPGFIMVRSGIEKYGMVNVEPFERAIQPGELIVVDAGANYHYYWSDYMRMASMGEPSAEQRRFFDANLASQKAGVAAVRAGNTMNDVFSACYDVLMEHGMKEHVPGLERVGHGLGLDVHEPPSIAKGSDTVIEPGMVLTVEPIYWDRPDHVIGNFAIEDILLVTDDGCEILSGFPKDLYIVDC